jgi:hypothetical protein
LRKGSASETKIVVRQRYATKIIGKIISGETEKITSTKATRLNVTNAL